MMEGYSAQPSLVSLCHDYEHYLCCIAQFDDGIGGWLPDYKQWVKTSLGKNVVEKLDVTLKEGDRLRILGVGSGEGEVECNILSRLLTKFPKIHNTVLDPSESQLNIYKNRLSMQNGHDLSGVEYDWHVQTLGQYRMSNEAYDTKFHVISALFCLYYEPDIVSSLSYLYSRLEPGGVLLAGLESEHCDLIKIEERFQFAQDDRNPLFSSRDIRNFFAKRNIPYSVYDQLENHHDFDITACFDNSSQEGDLLLDFISNVLHFRQSVPVARLNQFRDYLKYLATFRDGKAFLYYDAEHIIATK